MNTSRSFQAMLSAFDPLINGETKIERQTPRGKVFPARVRDCDLDAFCYLPTRPDPEQPPLICIHGISRNALEHVFAFRRYADEIGFPIVAPVFDVRTLRGYQTLGSNYGWNALGAMSALLDQLPKLTGGWTGAPNFFGFSGGGQFVHRMAMAAPHRVNALVIASAGWYTFPVETLPYPLGLAQESAIAFNLPAFLATPMLVMAGSQDRDRDAALRQGRKIDSLQGIDRVERARRWTGAVNDAARLKGLATPASYIELPGAGHVFADCVDAGLAHHAVEFLIRQNRRAAGAVKQE